MHYRLPLPLNSLMYVIQDLHIAIFIMTLYTVSSAHVVYDLSMAIAVSRGQGVPIAEKQLHLLERFESDWCTAPLMSSPPPYFTFNGIRLDDDNINAQYGARVNRSTSLQGHHQAKLELVIARVKPSVNNSIIVCWINSDVLLEYHLTIGE